MMELRTTRMIVVSSSKEEMITSATHVQHDTKSSRTSKMRKVLQRNMPSTVFNDRWRGLLTRDIATKEGVLAPIPTPVKRSYSDRTGTAFL